MKINNVDLVKRLEKAGFSNKEALIYVSVLELGGAFPSRIAEYASLNRSTTYKILVALSVRGIINEIEKRKKIYYQINKPEKVLRFTQNKLRQTEDAIEEIKNILPDLENIFSIGQNRPQITYLNGLEEILQTYDDMINQNRPYEMMAFSNANQILDIFPIDFTKKFVRGKEKKKVKTRAIIPDTERGRKYSEIVFEGVDKIYWPKIRFTKRNVFPNASEITIYGEKKVSIVNFTKDKMSGVIIEDEVIHNMMCAIFELAWKSNDVRE